MALKNSNLKRRLNLRTVLTKPEVEDDEDKDDPLLPILFQGAEGASAPYSYELMMIGPPDQDIDPKRLINTVARVGIRAIWNDNEDDADYRFRFGVFDRFRKIGRIGQLEVPVIGARGFRLYAGRLVSAFGMTALETRYRVFEGKNVKDIIRETLDGFPNLLINMNGLQGTSLPDLEYCVQFGESTFNFISRLMAEHGLCYQFDHESNPTNAEMSIFPQSPRALSCGRNDFELTDNEPEGQNLSGFTERFMPGRRRTHSGAFNELNPVHPHTGTEPIRGDYDLLGNEAGTTAEQSRFTSESFLGPFTSPNAQRVRARTEMEREEVRVFSISGQTRDPTLRAGRVLAIQFKDPEARKSYMITRLAIFAYENHHGQSFGQGLLDFGKELIKAALADPDDPAVMAANATLSSMRDSDEREADRRNWFGAGPLGELPSVGDMAEMAEPGVGTIAAGAMSVWTLFQLLKESAAIVGKDDFANAFDAVPWGDGKFTRPTPRAAKAVVPGPQLAVVIGPGGVPKKDESPVWADALGRVRVRFPWDLGPGGDADSQFASDKVTCWVRVSEAWAGDRWGTQFLPRIGQEVLVGFIDGNPDHPVVVGRVYNSMNGMTALPFPSPEGAAAPAETERWRKPAASAAIYRSGLKTISMPSTGKPGFHMLRLDDQVDKEQFLIRSQGRMDITAMRSRYDTTHGNLHELVGGKDDQGKWRGGSSFTTVGGEYNLHVGDARYENVDSFYDLTVGDELMLDAKNAAHIRSDMITIAGARIMLEASKGISLTVGASQIVLVPGTVYIDGAQVMINCGGPKGAIGEAVVDDAVDAGQADPGEPPDWLARQPKGGGGGHRHHTVPAPRAIDVSTGKDGKLRVGGPNSVVRVDPSDPHYADKVISSLDDYNNTPEGKRKLDELQEHGKPVEFEKPPVPIDPPVADVQATEAAGSTPKGQPSGVNDKDGNPILGTGEGSGSTVRYDPRDWPAQGDPDSPDDQTMLDRTIDLANKNAKGERTVPPNGAPPGGAPEQGKP